MDGTGGHEAVGGAALELGMMSGGAEEASGVGRKRQSTCAENESVSGSDSGSSNKRARAGGVRRGKWTPEEQAYADRLIHDFEAGVLDLPNGATLRAFLSRKLNCDPMRISKKFAGAKCLGKQIFLKRNDGETGARHGNAEVLKQLESDFLRSVSALSAGANARRRNRSVAGNGSKKSGTGASGTRSRSGNGKSPKSVAHIGGHFARSGKISSSDEGETDDDTDYSSGSGSDHLSASLGLHSTAGPFMPKLLITGRRGRAAGRSGTTSSCSDEDGCNYSSSDESSFEDIASASSMLAIEDIHEAMSALSGEHMDLPAFSPHSSLASVVVSSSPSSTIGPLHFPVPAMSMPSCGLEDDLTFLSAGEIIEPLGDFLPDECFTMNEVVG